MRPFLWQCQTHCLLSLAFIIDWRVVGGFQLCDVTASSHTLSTKFLGCSSKSWPPLCTVSYGGGRASLDCFRRWSKIIIKRGLNFPAHRWKFCLLLFLSSNNFADFRQVGKIKSSRSSSLWPLNLALGLWQAHNFRPSRPAFFFSVQQCRDRYVYMVLHNMFVVLCQKIETIWDLSRGIFLESEPAYKWRLRLDFTISLIWSFLKGRPNTQHRLRRTQRTSTIIGSNLLLRQVHCQIGTYVCQNFATLKDFFV